MSKILLFSKNRKKYENIPHKLKWAVPIHEAISSPEVKRQAKSLEVLVEQKIAAEEKAKRPKTISLVPRHPTS